MNINNHFSTQHRKFKKSTLHLLVGTMFLLLLPHANAAEFTKQLIVTTGVDYDSNPNLAETNQEPVWIYTLAPQIKLGINDEVNRWFLDATMLVQRYSNEKVLINREDPRLTMGWDRTYSSGLFGIKANYEESSARLAELKSTGVFSNIENTQKAKELAAKWQHDISPRWSILTESAYRDISFSNPGSLDGYSLGEIGSKLSYATTERLDTYAQLGYSHFRSDKIIDSTDLVRLMMGANYQIKDGFNLISRVGVNNLSGGQSRDDWEAGVKAEYTAERMYYMAELNRGELVPTGVGGFQQTDSLKLGWLFNISERDQIGADYGLFKSKKDKDLNLDWLDYQQVGAFYGRSLSNNWRTRFSVAHKIIEYPGVQSHGNVIGVTLVYDTLSF